MGEFDVNALSKNVGEYIHFNTTTANGKKVAGSIFNVPTNTENSLNVKSDPVDPPPAKIPADVDRLGTYYASWKDLANMYNDSFDNFFAEGGTVLNQGKTFTKTRIVKLIQCIRDFNYSAERINTLLKMINDKTLTKDNHPEWFNYDEYVKQLHGFANPETFIPKYILYTQDKPIDKLTVEDKSTICQRKELNVQRHKLDTGKYKKLNSKWDETRQ